MSTKKEFHTEVIWGQRPDPIFLKMQQNIALNVLAPLENTRQDGEKCEFEYNVSNLVSIETLIATHRFNRRLFLNMLKTLETLNLQLDQYMLSVEMLIFRDDALYFDTSMDQFVWLLLPFNRINETVVREQLYFFRHLFIELEQCHIENINTLLMKSNFSIDELKVQFLSDVRAMDPSNALPLQKEGQIKRFTNAIHSKLRLKKDDKKTSKHQPNKSSETVQNVLNLKKTAYVQRHPILISRDQPAVQYKVYYETCLIGRDDRCEISIDETSISREHAKLYTQNATYLIEDLNSTNGTYVNNKKILKKTPIEHGDELRIGHCDFIFLI